MPLPGIIDGTPTRKKVRQSLAVDRAIVQHGAHLDDVRQQIAREHELVLASHAAFIETARPVVTRIGRWGRG